MRIRYALAALSIAALSVSVIAAPTGASAETTVIKKVYRDNGPRAEMRMHRDRGMHRMHRGGDRVVIIKRHRHH
jgi:hypothetical protein